MAPNPDRRGAGGVARAKTKMVDDGHELMQLAYDAMQELCKEIMEGKV